MVRTFVALWLSIFWAVGPCLAQMTPEQIRKAELDNAQHFYQALEREKDQYARALARADAEHDPALKSKLDWYAAKEATEIGTDYERPNINAHTGLTADYVQARTWYALGTKYGDTDGAYWLAQLYWDGHGGPPDRERAKDLWLWAAENGERKAVAKLESLGYNMQKERELAFGKAQAPRTQADNARDAAEGMLIVLGALLVARVAHDMNETPECREARLAILAGTAPPYMPPGCN